MAFLVKRVRCRGRGRCRRRRRAAGAVGAASAVSSRRRAAGQPARGETASVFSGGSISARERTQTQSRRRERHHGHAKQPTPGIRRSAPSTFVSAIVATSGRATTAELAAHAAPPMPPPSRAEVAIHAQKSRLRAEKETRIATSTNRHVPSRSPRPHPTRRGRSLYSPSRQAGRTTRAPVPHR